uniref:Uncharacterized protein n=1 Tax=Timema poppense TaxID=170557 RepID=A0A7R9GUN5_TIMPO|nr:unnamed protein product [Timema poppensis]
MQDQGFARKDKHLHQDSSPWRRTRVRRHWPQRRCGQGQERDPFGRRTLLPDPSLAQEQYGGRRVGRGYGEPPWTSGQRPRPRDNPG